MVTYAEAATTAPRWQAAEVRRRVWAWVRVLGGLAILGLLVWRLGTGGFRDGLRVIDAGTLLAASGIGVLTTVLSAWRWCLVARGLGISLSLTAATADYYRALFLNAALPGGILGDVHRAVRHGRDVGDLGLGVRAVALERFAGQAVVVAVGLTVLFAFPSSAELIPAPPVVASGLAAVALAVAVVVAIRLRRADSLRRAGSASEADSGRGVDSGREGGSDRQAGSRWARALRTGGSTVRRGLLARAIWPWIVISSTMVLAGYLATFLVAARAAGATAPTAQLVPLLVLALLAMMLPMNVGGWGPREGVCAWAFGAAGLGATQGLTVAVVYGLSVFVASLPGAAVLAVRWLRSR